ncbi:fatty acid--CoA ligase family protein [Nocardia vinacea]|uniref:class I adenylate-forming enzyme family protein n=1 Tax=Nocardia vinacea TaxID=96468 RepID=UPI0034020D22
MSTIIEQVLSSSRGTALIIDDVRWSGDDLLGAAGELTAAISRSLGEAQMLTVATSNAALIVTALTAAEYLQVPLQLVDPAATLGSSASVEDVLIGESLSCGTDEAVAINAQLRCHVQHRESARRHSLRGPSLPRDGILFQTSGSTAAPRAVVKRISAVIRDGARIANHLHGAESPHVVCAAPAFHSYGFTHGVLAGLLTGSVTAFCPSSTLPQALAKLAARTNADTIIGLPIHVHMIAAAKSLDFAGLKQMVSSGSPLRADAVARIHRDHEFRVLNAYGASEAGTISIATLLEGSAPSSIGEPLSEVEVRLDPQDGELLVRNDSFAVGYLTDGELRSLPTVDGWYRSGDMVERDTNGLRITGRLGDVINIAGRKTRRSRLEAVLSLHPDILEVQVITATDEFRGEYPVARLVLKPGHARPDILDWSRDKLDAFEVPRQIQWMDRLPRTATGKLIYAPTADDVEG